MDTVSYHDDVIKWKHFPRYLSFVRGIHRSPVNSPHKGQWRGALMFSLKSLWIIVWVNNREAGDLRCYIYRAHSDVIVMCSWFRVIIKSHDTKIHWFKVVATYEPDYVLFWRTHHFVYALSSDFGDYDHVGYSSFGKMETKYKMRLMRSKGLCRYLFIFFFLYIHLQFKTQRSDL